MGEIVSIFTKFFPENFYEYYTRGIEPPFTCQNVIYGGDTVGGRGSFDRRTPMPRSREVGILLITS
jgi:hypothetical protein